MKPSLSKCAEKKKGIYLLLMVLLITLVLCGGAKINAMPERGLLCHSMKPEYYTWQASPHGKARVSCMSCHSPPGIKGFFTAKVRGFKEVYSAITQSYVSPIRMKGVIPDAACERCHSLTSLNQRDYGDIIIPHDLHKANKVNCVKCHTGLTHGQIAERKVTYVSDYVRWERVLGEGLMADKGYTNPDMDVCFRCHKLRNGPVVCTACHKSSKIPANHKTPGFKEGGHGRIAGPNVKACDNCHRFMSENKIEMFGEQRKFEEFIGAGKIKTGITASYYSRVNTFCKGCHSKRPKSHDSKYLSNHRAVAEISKSGCLTCHNNQQHRPDASILGTGSLQSLTQFAAGNVSADTASSQSNDAPPSKVTCGTCHPSSHAESTRWKEGFHPVPIPAERKITRYCYYCHRETECSTCHGKVQSIKVKKEE